uniref:Uncharacterized protein n=1 Tax=Oryza punctata TaxID=4537 RepID=A0A0E0MDB9_ORYPU
MEPLVETLKDEMEPRWIFYGFYKGRAGRPEARHDFSSRAPAAGGAANDLEKLRPSRRSLYDPRSSVEQEQPQQDKRPPLACALREPRSHHVVLDLSTTNK